jgi:hypothetical protein
MPAPCCGLVSSTTSQLSDNFYPASDERRADSSIPILRLGPSAAASTNAPEDGDGSRHTPPRTLSRRPRPTASRPASVSTGSNTPRTRGKRANPYYFSFPSKPCPDTVHLAGTARRHTTRARLARHRCFCRARKKKNSKGKKGEHTSWARVRRKLFVLEPRESPRKVARSTATPRVAGRHMARWWERPIDRPRPGPREGSPTSSTSQTRNRPSNLFLRLTLGEL